MRYHEAFALLHGVMNHEKYGQRQHDVYLSIINDSRIYQKLGIWSACLVLYVKGSWWAWCMCIMLPRLYLT